MAEVRASNPLFVSIDEHAPSGEPISMDTMVDPFTPLRKLAEQGPVARGLGSRFGNLELPNFWGHHEDCPSVAVLSYDHCLEVMRDGELFSSDMFAQTMEMVIGRSLFCMDPPEHTSYRRLIQAGFTPAKTERWTDEIIEPTVLRAVDAVSGKGRADLAVECTSLFPWEVMAQILGLPAADTDFVADRLSRMIGGAKNNPVDAFMASQELRAYVAEHVARTRENPDDRFVSALIRAEADGQRLDDEHLAAFVMHMFPAGLETTFRAASSMLHLLLSNPDQLAAVMADPSLDPAVIEETLRVEGPATMMPRTATRDTTLAGLEIKKGTVVFVMLATANRDPGRWSGPDRFDVHRPARPHLGFGAGPHTCIGLHLARREMSALLKGMRRSLPGLRWDPAVPVPPITGWSLRAALSVPAVWNTPNGV